MLGGFTIGAVIALGLFGVPKEEALAMALIVQGSTLFTVASLGGIVLWLQGIGTADLRAAWRRQGSVPTDLPALPRRTGNRRKRGKSLGVPTELATSGASGLIDTPR